MQGKTSDLLQYRSGIISRIMFKPRIERPGEAAEIPVSKGQCGDNENRLQRCGEYGQHLLRGEHFNEQQEGQTDDGR